MSKILFATLITASLSLNAGFMDSVASQVGSMMQGGSSSTAPQKGATTNQNQTQLLSQLTQLVNVDSKQAIGGTAALMALASSKMPKSNYNSLLSSVPGLSSIVGSGGGSALGSIAGAMGGESATATAFKALGMDNSTIAKFAPALLEIFKNYTSSENINLLSQAWSGFLNKK